MTIKQRKIYDFIEDFKFRNGYDPSYTNIAKHFGIAIPTVWQYIQALERQGYIKKPKGRAREFIIKKNQNEL